jgi:hypothetical protein
MLRSTLIRDPEIDTPKMKAMYTLLVVLTAGVFTNPGTAIKIDQDTCGGKSPSSEDIQNPKAHHSSLHGFSGPCH